MVYFLKKEICVPYNVKYGMLWYGMVLYGIVLGRSDFLGIQRPLSASWLGRDPGSTRFVYHTIQYNTISYPFVVLDLAVARHGLCRPSKVWHSMLLCV